MCEMVGGMEMLLVAQSHNLTEREGETGAKSWMKGCSDTAVCRCSTHEHTRTQDKVPQTKASKS